eukprot:749795-Hanusia_phi.AAC.7
MVVVPAMCRGRARSVNIDVKHAAGGRVERLTIRGDFEEFQWMDWEEIQLVRQVSIPAGGGDVSVETCNLLGALKSLTYHCFVGLRGQGKVRFQHINRAVMEWSFVELEGTSELKEHCEGEQICARAG